MGKQNISVILCKSKEAEGKKRLGESSPRKLLAKHLHMFSEMLEYKWGMLL